jgi:N-dimethylarginine dimethylaminohydrolase
MAFQHRILMTDPAHFEVTYAINPWMQPGAWAQNPEDFRRKSRAAWDELAAQLTRIGFTTEVIPAAPGLPDLVFPANAAVVFNGTALLARFRHPERRGEEPVLKRFFEGLKARGLINDVRELPDGVFHEGAGDCIWDAQRQLFWAGYGPRSSEDSLAHIRRTFGQETVGLELRTAHFYHLDTCFCPLPGGEVLYYPGAFTPMSLAEITAHVPADMRIAATVDEAATFSLNAVAFGRDVVMATPPQRLRTQLEERGYRVHDVDLSAFMLSGGAAYCMTLRLDLQSQAAKKLAAE